MATLSLGSISAQPSPRVSSRLASPCDVRQGAFADHPTQLRPGHFLGARPGGLEFLHFPRASTFHDSPSESSFSMASLVATLISSRQRRYTAVVHSLRRETCALAAPHFHKSAKARTTPRLTRHWRVTRRHGEAPV